MHIELRPLIPPSILIEELPLTEAAQATVIAARQEAEAIVLRQDDRLLVVVGPCSIHDPEAALEYGTAHARFVRQVDRAFAQL